jgi:hypothetical protein
MVHGFIPGPDMLTKHLDFTYSMVWSIALANIFGAGLCFLLSGQFAKVSTLRYTLILPVIMPVIYVGAFQGSRSWGDLFVLLIAGVIGWTMKRLKWARPPLILGLVLGVLMERYMSISFVRYGTDWLTRPVVMVLLGLAALVFFKPLFSALRRGGIAQFRPSGSIVFRREDWVYVFFIGIGVYMLCSSQGWLLMARIGPTVVASILVLAGSVSLAYKVFVIPATGAKQAGGGIHMDVSSEHDETLTRRVVLTRAARFFGWFLAFLGCMSVIGMLPTVPLMIAAYMRIEGREPWKLSLILALCVTVFLWLVFDQILHIPWPDSFISRWIA